jgi:diguanylate cyclase
MQQSARAPEDHAASTLAARHAVIEQVWQALVAADLDPTPDNYTAMYARVTGAAPAPSTALVERLLEDAQAHVAAAGALVGESRTATAEYGDALADTARDLALAAPSQQLVRFVVDLTRSMVERTQAAEMRLAEMGGQMEAMRGSLSDAQRSAEIDTLTGLPNRRSYERRLANATAAARADGSPLTLAICDIDHFKQVNDMHGHDLGDRVLRFVADLLGQVADEDTLVARFGGEEFVLLFEHLPIERVVETIDRLRLDLSTRRIVNRDTGERIGSVTFSAGIAEFQGDAPDLSLFREADRALYAAKESGRDRTVIAPGWANAA